MKNCPFCNNAVNDDSNFCSSCGNRIPEQAQPPVYQAPPVYAQDPFDHTAEFNAKDISDNKAYALIIYLMNIVGVIIALLGAKDSAYVQFHVRQSLKISITEALVGLAMALLCFTIIVPIVGAIVLIVLQVVRIITFFQICGGKAKEPVIIRSLGFLK